VRPPPPPPPPPAAAGAAACLTPGRPGRLQGARNPRATSAAAQTPSAAGHGGNRRAGRRAQHPRRTPLNTGGRRPPACLPPPPALTGARPRRAHLVWSFHRPRVQHNLVHRQLLLHAKLAHACRASARVWVGWGGAALLAGSAANARVEGERGTALRFALSHGLPCSAPAQRSPPVLLYWSIGSRR
jgi:hypothetical protein